MSKIKEIPSKIYVNALVVAGVPTAKVVRADIRSQEKQGDIEYTLLNSIWRKPSETPKKYPADIITHSSYGEEHGWTTLLRLDDIRMRTTSWKTGENAQTQSLGATSLTLYRKDVCNV